MDPASLEELKATCSSIQKCLELRFKYLRLSLQRPIDNPRHQDTWEIYPNDNQNSENWQIPSEDTQTKYRLEPSGVFQIYASKEDMDANKPMLSIPTVNDFCADLKSVFSVSNDGPAKTFAADRLAYLDSTWDIYSLRFGHQESRRIKVLAITANTTLNTKEHPPH